MDDSLHPIYLDYNATTPPADEVVAAITGALERAWGNPSSAHAPGLAAREALQKSREKVADLFGVDSGQIIFTSGGTEANNMALWSAWQRRDARRTRVVLSAVEHPSVLKAAQGLTAYGAEVLTCRVDAHGVLDMTHYHELVDERTAVVALMYANNEVGTLQPVREAALRAHEVGARVLCDAVQAVGKIPVSLSALGVDYLSCAGHKLYGPKGAGCLVAAHGAPCVSLLRGGGQERGLRSGTENVADIAGLGEACRLAPVWAADAGTIAGLRDAFEARLSEEAGGEVVSRYAPRLPNTLGLLVPGVDAHALLVRLSRRGVYISGGSACSTGKSSMSHVLQAMGLQPDQGSSFVRLSLGRLTTRTELASAGDVIVEEVRALRGRGGRPRRGAGG